MLEGSINHISVTVSHVPEAMRFFRPLLRFLDYVVPDADDDRPLVSVSRQTGGAFNLWEARPELRAPGHRLYAPGLHHIAFNAGSRERVDALAERLPGIGGRILDGPSEWPYTSVGRYYAVYFLGPDDLKFEYVHMDELERLHREAGTHGRSLWTHDGG